MSMVNCLEKMNDTKGYLWFFFIEFRDIIDIRYHLESNVHETSL